MKKLRKNVPGLRKLNKKGQGMLEYVMLLAVVAMVVLVFKDNIRKQVEKLTDGVANTSSQVLSQ